MTKSLGVINTTLPNFFRCAFTQPAFTCSASAIETPQPCVKYVQSYNIKDTRKTSLEEVLIDVKKKVLAKVLVIRNLLNLKCQGNEIDVY